jgi:NADH-quinone oxidoreductase subunit H
MQPLFDFLGNFLGGPANAFILVAALVKIALIVGGLLSVIPIIILFERKIISWVQDRPGPNRAGPWGSLQGILDGVKLFFKEEIMPKGVDKGLYLAAPCLVVVPAFLALCLVPVGPIIAGEDLTAFGNLLGLDPAMVGPMGEIKHIAFAITNPNVGILYVLAVTSISVYGITLAGWSSNNKWSLLGGIRASAQMVSYEITLSLAIVGALLVSGSLNLYDIIGTQYGGFWNWNVIAQPVACLLFIIAMFAETNRLPFDLAEAEPELTGGFHTEYSSMRFAMFFMGEYINMAIVSAMCATLFLGGFLGPIQMSVLVDGGWNGLAESMGSMGWVAILGKYLAGPLIIFPAKITFFIVLFIFIRAVWPRLRYDQLMSLGWKKLLPIGLINIVITTIVVAIDLARNVDNPDVVGMSTPAKWILGIITLSLFVGWDVLVFSPQRKKQLNAEYKLYGEKRGDPGRALAS